MSESLSVTELECQLGEELPERSVLALINLNSILASNVSAAVNAGTVNSIAWSSANQYIRVSQR